ncbi:hypothetical protein DSM44344_01321 [Mycobacterium marinum]|nr:hypothetical protein DSM44344_01321 [Mycobacterium marinum]
MVNNNVPSPHKNRWTAAIRDGTRKVSRLSARLGGRPSIYQRRARTVLEVIQKLPTTNAVTSYPAPTPKVSHLGASVMTLGSGMATNTSSNATPIATRFAAMMDEVSMSWMRTRRRCGVSVNCPSSREPYA